MIVQHFGLIRDVRIASKLDVDLFLIHGLAAMQKRAKYDQKV